LLRNPFSEEPINPGPYRMGKRVEDANTYRVGHPLAQRILEHCKALDTPPVEVRFDYSGSGKRIALLDGLVGRQGWLMCSRLTLKTFDTEDHLLFAATEENGSAIPMNWPSRGFGSSSKKATRARQSLRRHSSVAIRERSQSNSGMQRTRPCAERLRRSSTPRPARCSTCLCASTRRFERSLALLPAWDASIRTSP